MNRREARKQAFLLLFQYKFQPDGMKQLLEDFFAENKTGDQGKYIEAVVCGTLDNIEKIDEMLEDCSDDWKIERISSVCLAALRLGAFEIMSMEDIPPAVSINEAVALAKEFDGEEAAPFVNGVLDKLKNKLK